MTWQEFRDWYDTLDQDSKLKVMRLIIEENFDKKLPKEHPSIKAARENVRREFYRAKGLAEEGKHIPHAAQVVNQFYVEYRLNEKPDFMSTGKLMCWCNCGETTGWLDAYTEMSEVSVFLAAHEVEQEIGYRMHYHLGELTGYSVNSDRLPTRLLHTCGWEKELLIVEDHLLTSIVLEILDSRHICGENA